MAAPGHYRRLLVDGASSLDLWETVYHQELRGDDPVLTWVEGSVLRPVLGALDGAERDRFRDACRRAYAEAYPPEAGGVTVVPFRRLFCVATRALTARSEP